MLVKDIMTTSVSCVSPQTSLKQVAKKMKQENIGVIPVCNDSGIILGIITDRDLVLRGLSNDIIPLSVSDIMSRNITYVTPSTNVHEAALLLSNHQIRRLPVVTNNRLVGIVSIGDIARVSICIDEAGDALSAISKPHGFV